MSTQHATGCTCHVCGGVPVAGIDGTYLCAAHTIDLRAEEPTVTVPTG